jgi:hypothetical protein
MNYEKYKNTLLYPGSVKKPSMPNTHPTAEEATAYIKELSGYKDSLTKNGELRRAYDAENSRLYDLFKADALEEAGLTGHPNADKIFAKSWEDGHSSGYYEVFSILCDLAELVR